MGAGGATLLAAFDHLLAKPHLGPILGGNYSVTLELGPGKDEQSAEVVLVEVSNRVEQVAVKGHLSGHFERCEQPDDGAAIGESPTQWWAQALGVTGTQGIPMRGMTGEVLDPHLSVGIVVGHANRGRSAATNARGEHGTTVGRTVPFQQGSKLPVAIGLR